MRKSDDIGIDIEIDELTNSIINLISGDSFSTEISRITKIDLKNVAKKDGWLFDWKLELKHPEREVYKLTITNNQSSKDSLALKLDQIMFLCTSLRALLSTKGKQSCMLVFLEILLPSRVSYHSSEDMMEMLLSYQKLN